ncbi:unnamed protein product [Anisakis simplex]|uniref:Major sperm protein n=1 Tax=Anisakis simplex TaxID=6269 RepID=A0A0M3K987_ANISI|nr:unnamed protein product [Anisakis simplex]
MWLAVVLFVLNIALHSFLITLCKGKKAANAPPPAAVPKQEEKPTEPEKKEGESSDAKKSDDKDKKDEKKEEKKEEQKEEQNDKSDKKINNKKEEGDKKDDEEQKKEGEEEKEACMPNELHWKIEDGTIKYGNQSIMLHNTVGKRLAFKMKTTDANIYTVKPPFTFLDKDEIADIEVTHVEGGEAKQDQILLYYTAVDDEKATEPESLFKKDDDSYEHYTVQLIVDA